MKDSLDSSPDEVDPRPSASATAPMPGLRARKKARQKQELARVVLDLHRELGPEGATVEEICRRAEISQPTFYKYYPSKEAVLTEHATRGLAELLTSMLERPGPLEPRLFDFAAALAEQVVRERALWRAVAVSNAYSPARDTALLASIDVASHALQTAFAAAQESGELTREFSPHALAGLFEGMLARICVEHCARPEQERPVELAVAEALAFFMRAARG